MEARDEFISRLPQWIRRHGPELRKALERLEARDALVWDDARGQYGAGDHAVEAWLDYAGRFEDRVLWVVLGDDLERLARRWRPPGRRPEPLEPR